MGIFNPHPGSWGGLPDIGATEWAQDKLVGVIAGIQGKDVNSARQALRTPEGGSNLFGSGQVLDSQTSQPNQSTQNQSTINYTPAPSNNNSGGGNTGGGTSGSGQSSAFPAGRYVGWDPTAAQADWAEKLKQGIGQASQSQEDAAAAAAEARRQAAKRAYDAKAVEAEQGKKFASEQYNWLIDTLGSNKKDRLESITLEESRSVEDYGRQETKTRSEYDAAKGEILNTYRDLAREQEKLLRGSGQGQSSRALEAQMKLNNLLGKDMSQVSTNEADAIALIGTAIQRTKENASLARDEVESEVQTKLDQAAFDYSAQVNAIDSNLRLSANEREDAYAAAQAQLAQDKADIEKWASGLRLQVDQTIANMALQLDDYVSSTADQSYILGTNLNQKASDTNNFLASINASSRIAPNESLNDPAQGVYQGKQNQSYGSKEALDDALAQGRITPLEYSANLSKLQSGGQSSLLAGGQSIPTTQGANNTDLLARTLLRTA